MSPGRRRSKGVGNPGKPGKRLRLEDLQSQFGVGLKEAANRLGICPTTLKRACRRHGIQRWPRRQLLKLSKAIDQINATGTVKGSEGAAGTPGALPTDTPVTLRLPGGPLQWLCGEGARWETIWLGCTVRGSRGSQLRLCQGVSTEKGRNSCWSVGAVGWGTQVGCGRRRHAAAAGPGHALDSAGAAHPGHCGAAGRARAHAALLLRAAPFPAQRHPFHRPGRRPPCQHAASAGMHLPLCKRMCAVS